MNDCSEVFITSIARIAHDSEVDSTFNYGNSRYKKLLEWNEFHILLGLKRNANGNSGFYLKPHEINGCQHLVLSYLNNPDKIPAYGEREQRNFLINSFFESFNLEHPISDQLITKEKSEAKWLSLDEFYEHLRTAHELDDTSFIPENIQIPSLRPILRPYQVHGIKWMMKQELKTEMLPDFSIKLRSKFDNSQIFYYYQYSQMLTKECLNPIPVPSGGLLTDEMGLGKTVEIIGLILMNPHRVGLKRKLDENDLTEDSKENKSMRLMEEIKCICHGKAQKRNLILCKICSTSQHVNCVFQRQISDDDRDDYKCPFCWKTTEEIINSPTTIIVMPASIKAQWKDEISRHISDRSFKTLMYNGISSGWVSPSELIKYDAVITDFNTLSSELYFTDKTSQNRALRHDKKYKYPPSPLPFVRWWRVVLDEAQMVENKNNRPSLMVRQLPAVHRWATTGTPVESSIYGLYGLLYFINLQPYSNEEVFRSLFNDYQLGYHENMIKVLSKVMWRTCKKNVEHEINIPKQTEIVHEVEMTDLQKYFYRQAHLSTKPKFTKNLNDYLVKYRMGSQQVGEQTVEICERIFDPSMKNNYLYNLDNATLRSFLEPLRSLRQDCTIPSKFHQTNDQTRIRQTLKPEQLHEHLVSKASIETKSALRTICSSINGIAALKISERKFNEAVNLYKQVLNFSKEYTSFVTVDSMLQIHAYQGLIDIATTTELKEDTEDYTIKMGKLEWKYASNYYDKVKEVNEEIKDHAPELRKTFQELTDTDGHWWRVILVQTRGQEQKLFEIINLEVFSAIPNNSQVLEQLRSSQGIQLIITEWCDKIKKYTQDIKKRFNNLNFIITNLQPLSEMSSNEREKVSQLAKDALKCHLHLFDEENEDDNAENHNSKRKAFCLLCKLKAKLNEYECLLFNKTLTDDVTEGTWNPRFEEKLLKAVWNFAKRSDLDDGNIAMGKYFFNHLEALKTQFKLQAKLWVEVNYTISAFDELNMCKMRMEVVETADEITEEDSRFKLKIARYDVEDQLRDFMQQRQEGEINFVRLNGRLKYLEHLKERKEAQVCPICTNQPQERYFVTICGHLICAECFSILVKNRKRMINCPICRTSQETKNIYAVTCPENHSEPINGSLSPKIDEIIRSILRLRKAEPDVKILIFSHWDQILQAIATGLLDNEISYRTSFNSKFTKQIFEFKDYTQNVTCMLLNLKFGGKGLNLIEATHVFLVEPILKADEELQAVGRVHRIGQTRETFIHRFICKETIEETLYNKIIREKQKWIRKKFTIKDLEDLLNVETEQPDDEDVQIELLNLTVKKAAIEKMESTESPALIKEDIEDGQLDVKGNGNLKRKHGIDASSDDENDFLGFNLAEQNDSQHMIQNIKKMCTDSSSDETTPRRQQQGILRVTDILDPAFKLPFTYGWKRELVLRAEPTMSKEKGEVYYITPTGKKLRTRHEIINNLHDDLTINNFTLIKEAIGADGNDEIIRPAKYYNYSRRSHVDPVITEATPPPLGKRVPKPKMPKGASPPPSNSPATPTSSNVSLPLFTPNHNRSLSLKENMQDVNKVSSPTRKTAVKGKLKGDARCTIQCPPPALGKIPQLQCKVCLCLYHHECAKKPHIEGTSFTCENCNFKFTKSTQSAPSKKHHQPPVTAPQAPGTAHNFEKNPQTIVTLNGKKFIVYETDASNGIAKKVSNRAPTQKPTESASKTNVNRSFSDTSVASISPFNFSTNFLRNVSTGFDVLLHTFQYLKVQELQRASRVCRMWNLVAQSSKLWRTVRMKNSHVNDWEGFVRTLKRNGTNHLDLRKVFMGNQEEAWREFSDMIGRVDQLQGIDLCRCQSTVVENLFVSNPNFKIINALSLKDEKLSLEGLKNRQTPLEELRIRSVHASGLQILNFEFAPLIHLRHLSLTTVENLHTFFNDNAQLRELTALESLELGHCDQLNDDQFAENLGFLEKLQRLRIEKGSQSFNINKVLDVIAGKLQKLIQLELINCDVKNDFVEAIRACQNVKRLLLIPTYVSQSAATNFMIMEGVMHLSNLETIHWVVTNELLRVTELYLDQSDNRPEKGKKSPEKQVGSGASSPVKARDCIPVLKPVPGKEETDEETGSANKQQQVEIVALKTVEAILQKKLTGTIVKLLKISHQHTWRQVIEST